MVFLFDRVGLVPLDMGPLVSQMGSQDVGRGLVTFIADGNLILLWVKFCYRVFGFTEMYPCPFVLEGASNRFTHLCARQSIASFPYFCHFVNVVHILRRSALLSQFQLIGKAMALLLRYN